MTGTGTQTDPYIPENWEEFVEAVGKDGAYVSCPENAVWDMNESMPAGITSAINIKAKQILGNNMTIKNPTFINSMAFDIKSEICEIIKLNFLNIYTTMNSTHCFSSVKTTFFRNCKFSGIISHGSFFSQDYPNTKFNFTNDTGGNPKGCSFNLEFYGNGTMYTGSPEAKFENCNIHISGENNSQINTELFSKCLMINCYISGKCPSNTSMYISLKNNIYDIEVSEGKVYNYTPNNYEKTVINDSIVNDYDTDTVFEDYLIKATEEQMHDAEYLKSQGFMIGVG